MPEIKFSVDESFKIALDATAKKQNISVEDYIAKVIKWAVTINLEIRPGD